MSALDAAKGQPAPLAGPAGAGTWALAFRFARRELRGGLAGFRLFLGCLIVGVAAIAAVGSLAAALVTGLGEGGQTLLGGDVSVRLIHREASEAEYQALAAGGTVSTTAQLRGMARTPDLSEQSLIELKAVDGRYPLYGALEITPEQPLDDVFETRDGYAGAAVDGTLLNRLGLEVGDRIRLGEADFEIRAEILREPDRVSGGFAIGPRVMISQAAFPSTGLIRPGSLINYSYRIRLPEDARTQSDVRAFVSSLEETFPEAGWRIQDRSNSAPGTRNFVQQLALFLSLVGLTALLVGGVGVANAVKSYLDGKRETIATFKCLGAPGALIFRIYLLQVMALAGIGIAVGLAIGATTPYIVGGVAANLIPIPVAFGIYPGALALAAAYGVLTALAFAVWPLARARDVAAAGLFRDIVSPARTWPKPGYIALAGGSLVLLALLAILFADQRTFALWFVLGAIGVFAILRLAAAGLMAAAGLVRGGTPEWRLALANIHRPGAPTPSVVLSLGLGVTLLTVISLIDGNLSARITSDLPERAPSFFFVDIQPDQADQFAQAVRGTTPNAELERVPMLRGRIAMIDGVPAAEAEVAPEEAWALRGDRGITYSADPPKNSPLVRGEWWPQDYQGPLLVSLDEDMAKGFGVGLGDTLTVNVLGRDLTATIANTRAIDWQSLGINFVLVFSPGVIEQAPQTELATVTLSSEAPAQDEERLERMVAQTFPNVTSVRVKDVLETVNGLLGDFALAIRATSIVTILAGVLVLAGAMLAGFRRRRREAVLLKVLGATRQRILTIYLTEYAVLGFATALVAAGAGTLAAYLVVSEVMQLPWTFLPGTMLLTVVGATLVTIAFGLAGTWQALSAPAARILRTD